MNRQYYVLGSEVNPISAMDAEEIKVKGDEGIQAVKACIYNINQESKPYFEPYIGGYDVKKIAFISGIRFPLRKKAAKAVAKNIGDIKSVIPKDLFPKKNSADFIILLSWTFN